jgi:hypothetical protein
VAYKQDVEVAHRRISHLRSYIHAFVSCRDKTDPQLKAKDTAVGSKSAI